MEGAPGRGIALTAAMSDSTARGFHPTPSPLHSPLCDGLPKAKLDVMEAAFMGPGPLRPRDAGTLILLDRSGKTVRVLMGRRHMRHVFMPGKFVFPGGRTDPSDSRITVASGLHPHEEHKLRAARAASLRRAPAPSPCRPSARPMRRPACCIGEKVRVCRRQTGLAGLCRPRRAPVARRPAHDRPRDHAARPRAPLRHPLPRRLARRRRGGTARWRADGGTGRTRLAAHRRGEADRRRRDYETILGELEQRLAADPTYAPAAVRRRATACCTGRSGGKWFRRKSRKSRLDAASARPKKCVLSGSIPREPRYTRKLPRMPLLLSRCPRTAPAFWTAFGHVGVQAERLVDL